MLPALIAAGFVPRCPPGLEFSRSGHGGLVCVGSCHIQMTRLCESPLSSVPSTGIGFDFQSVHVICGLDDDLVQTFFDYFVTNVLISTTAVAK